MKWTQGEVVESVAFQSSWRLQKEGEPTYGNHQASHKHIQFHCKPAPKAGSKWSWPSEAEQWECGRQDVMHYDNFKLPKWQHQWNRLTCPCENDWDHHWARSVKGMSLGHMMAFLGDRYSAKEIVEYFMSCRLVAVKYARDKTKNINGGPSVATGLPAVRKIGHLKTIYGNGPACLREIAEAFDVEIDAENLPGPTATQLFQSAEKLIAEAILQNTAVPWRSGQLGAGATGAVAMGAAWQIYRSLLLEWRCEDVLNICIGRVMDALRSAIPGTHLVGVVGVPAYNCMGEKTTRSANGEIITFCCGERAKMLPYLYPGGSVWLCRRCVIDNTRAMEGGASRVVHLHPLVQSTEANRPILVVERSKGVDLLLHAPPSDWDWPGLGDRSTRIPLGLNPVSAYVAGGRMKVIFSREDSDAIWKAARNYTPPTNT